MLSFAILALAAASAGSSPTLTTTAPWWEKVTYTISGDGADRSCQYESSLTAAGAKICDFDEAPSPVKAAASGSTGVYTKITIERRFTPGHRPDPGDLAAGDTLLGGQVMALAIDRTGAVRSCEVVAESDDVKPAYGCDEARAERFEASAGRAPPQVRQGFMTIVVYGHEEHLV